MAEHNELGKKGEELAIAFLLEKEYVILEKNYRYQKAEIDIIVQKENILVVVEVKTRSTNYFGNPEEFENQKKIKLLTMSIDDYVVKNDLDVEVRFDIVAITKKQNEFVIEHIEDAFLFF